jgi:hypothetical protein
MVLIKLPKFGHVEASSAHDIVFFVTYNYYTKGQNHLHPVIPLFTLSSYKLKK